MTAASAYVADVTPPERRAKAFGVLGSAFGVGFIVGPAIGGLVGNINPRLTFWAAALCCAVNVVYGIFVLPESLPPERRTARLEWQRANPVGSLKLLRSHHELWSLACMNFLSYVAHEAYPNIWTIYCIAVFGWSTGSIGLTLTLVGVLTLINQATLVGPIVARFGERRVLLASLVVAIAGTALMGTDNGIVFLIAIVIICLPMYNATSQSLMTRRVRASEQGELQGALGSVRGISMLIGPGLFTVVFAQFVGPWRWAGVPGAPWYLAALLYTAAFVVAWRATQAQAPPIAAEEAAGA